jgi:hypothetical protein
MNYLLLDQIRNELLLFLTFDIRGEYPHKPDIEPASFSKGTINFRFHLKKRKSPLKTVTPSQGSLPDKICGGGIIRSI